MGKSKTVSSNTRVTKAEVGKSSAIILLEKFNLHCLEVYFIVTASRRNRAGLATDQSLSTLSSRVQFVLRFVWYGWHMPISVLQCHTLHSVNVTYSYQHISWLLLNFFSQVESFRTRRCHIFRGCSWKKKKIPDASNVRYSPCKKSRKKHKKEN